MSEYYRVPTTAEVWAAMHASHEMKVYGSFSAPDGDQYGDPGKCVMFTSYTLENGDYPIIESRISWRKESPDNRKHEYWLCIAYQEDS